MDCGVNTVGTLRLRLWELSETHPIMCRCLFAGILLTLITLVSVKPAYAGWAEDFLAGGAQGVLDGASWFLGNIQTGSLTAGFTDLFGNPNVYEVVKSIHKTVISTLAYSVLAIVYLVQLVRIANKLDGNAAVPGLKEVIFLMIFFVIGKFIIDNSLVFCGVIYDGFNELTIMIQNNASGQVSQSFTLADAAKNDLGKALSSFLLSILIWFTALAATVITYVVILGRSIQAYVYVMLSPIPLAMLGAEETRSYGMGFIKNFVALCLTGAIIAITLIIWTLAAAAFSGGEIGSDNGPLVGIQTLALCFLLCLSMVKSSGWARDILGG